MTGWFERVMNRIPMEIASALLAGVLARFGMQAFAALQTALPLVLVMLAAYLLARRLLPRRGGAHAGRGHRLGCVDGQMRWSGAFRWPFPSLPAPSFSLQALDEPGPAAVHRHHGIAKPARRGGDARHGLPAAGLAADRMTGLVTLLLAPFGAFALNFSAITAPSAWGPRRTGSGTALHRSGLLRLLWSPSACSAQWSRGC